MDQANVPNSFATIGILGQLLPLTLGDVVAVVILLLSLGGNAFQLYRQRVYTKTVYNGLIGIFNSIGWLLARSVNKASQLNNRIEGADRYVLESGALRGFRDFCRETDFMLCVLHEQLVSVAKTLRGKDKRWQAGQFGYAPADIERIEERLRSQTETTR